MGLFSVPPLNATITEYVNSAKQNIKLFEQSNNQDLDYLLIFAVADLELAIKKLHNERPIVE